jgi:hypothetical protein
MVICIGFSVFFYHPRHPGNLARPAGDIGAWRLDQQGSTKGQIAVDGDAIRVKIDQIDGISFHLELYQHSTTLIGGRRYRVRFKAKSDNPIVFKVAAIINHPDWHNLGLNEETGTTREWKDFDYTFTATGADGQGDKVPSFLIGYTVGTLWIKDLLVEEA